MKLAPKGNRESASGSEREREGQRDTWTQPVAPLCPLLSYLLATGLSTLKTISDLVSLSTSLSLPPFPLPAAQLALKHIKNVCIKGATLALVELIVKLAF